VKIIWDNGKNRGCPGFNVAAILFKDFQKYPRDIRYADIGFKHVEWLNKTDRARFVKNWGKPETQRDPFELFRSDWDRAVADWVRCEVARREEFDSSITEILSGCQPKPKRRKRFFGLFG
jgi:hypothetical protein